MYHSIAERPDPRGLTVPVGRLAEQLAALVGAGYRPVGLTEALTRYRTDAVVAVTFDDGFRDFLTDALPVLRGAGASATLYPAVAHLGGRPTWRGASGLGPLLTWTELREVAAAGVEIGSHALVHRPLDVLPDDLLTTEVRGSRERIEQEVGLAVRSFAYPHGYHSPRVRSIVDRAGYDSACEVGRRLHGADGDRLAVPRLHVTAQHSGDDLLHLVRTGGSRLEPWLKDRLRPAWRAVRRAGYAVSS
jgi:peptidoglycan/xylan/chitin deacetylase (PgdA/CDA1 family)